MVEFPWRFVSLQECNGKKHEELWFPNLFLQWFQTIWVNHLPGGIVVKLIAPLDPRMIKDDHANTIPTKIHLSSSAINLVSPGFDLLSKFPKQLQSFWISLEEHANMQKSLHKWTLSSFSRKWTLLTCEENEGFLLFRHPIFHCVPSEWEGGSILGTLPKRDLSLNPKTCREFFHNMNQALYLLQTLKIGRNPKGKESFFQPFFRCELFVFRESVYKAPIIPSINPQLLSFFSFLALNKWAWSPTPLQAWLAWKGKRVFFVGETQWKQIWLKKTRSLFNIAGVPIFFEFWRDIQYAFWAWVIKT